jgi:hypothetical protein
METSDLQLDWDFLKLQLPARWRELAVDRGLIHRSPPHMHTKIDDIEQVLRLFFLRVGQDLSLQVAVAVVAAARHAMVEREGEEAAQRAMLVEMSAPALHYWERKLSAYLAELLALMLDTGALFCPMRWAGYEVVVVDGTTETCPGSEGTTARVLYALRLCDMQLIGCQVTDAHGCESMRPLDVRPGQLWIGDRLYAKPQEAACVVDAGADVLVRCNLRSLPLYDGKDKIDVLAFARELQHAGDMAERAVEVRPADHAPIKGRLCVMRLSDEAAAEARRRLRRDRPNASARAREAASYLILFTTVPAERLSTYEVFALYRLRWQVELEIKREKSIGGLSDLPNCRDDTVASWIYGKLLLQQIARKAVSPTVAFPPSAVAAAA